MFEGVTPEDLNDKNLLDINYGMEINQTTFSKLEFDKHDLFFRSFPNKINYDKVLVKNTGTTCIYFKWHKLNKPYNLPDKKGDGIDRFFCHYSDSKLFPNEEKEFTFSFFSEKNGLFAEDWILITSPPLKSSNLVIHLTGMCLQIQDKYTDTIRTLDTKLNKLSFKTIVYELVLDLVSSIKEDDPPLPDMTNEEVFKFYFQLYNKEYNVIHSKYAMKNFTDFVNSLFTLLGVPEEDANERFWNGSIKEIENLIEKIEDEETRENFKFKLSNLIHMARKQYPADSVMFNHIKSLILDLALEFPDISLQLKEELVLPPTQFDYLTRQSLTDQEILKYNQELNKKKDEFYKKAKKKPHKNAEEEEAEIANYKSRLLENAKERFLNKFKNIESESFKNRINEKITYSQIFDEEYVDRITRIKSLQAVKNEGLEGKNVVLRIDIEKYEMQYEDIFDEDGKFIKKQLKAIEFPHVKDTILQSMSFMFDNRAKSIILLCDFGPKTGVFNADFSLRYFYEFLLKENFLDNPIYFINDLEDLSDFDYKLENEIFKENCLIIVENLNFFTEEAGFEYEKHNLNLDGIAPNNPNTNASNLHNNSIINNSYKDTGPSITNLKYYTKMIFLEKLMNGSIYINDSTRSINKIYPTIIDFKFLSEVTKKKYVKALGFRIYNEIQKIPNFFMINSPNYMLVIGDDDLSNNLEIANFKEKNRQMSNSLNKSTIHEEQGKNVTEDDKNVFNRLLILNFILLRFKTVFIFGKLALYFLQFIQKDYIFDVKFDLHPYLANLVKFIIAKAELNQIEIILPEDGRYILKSEYVKFFNSDLNYTKYIKTLFKREKIANDLENLISDEDELNDNPDYIKNKLNEEEKELIGLYKNNSIDFKSNQYVRAFFEIQDIANPKKILKNELEYYYFYKNMYYKPIITPPPGILENLHNYLQMSNQINDSKIEKSIINNNSNINSNSNSNNQQSNTQIINNNNSQSHQNPSNHSILTEKKIEVKPIIDNNLYHLIDYGEKSYEKLTSYIGKNNCLMWLGKFSPSIVENLWDNYSATVKAIHDRKSFLREKFAEIMMEEEKKLDESDQKAKKHLFTVFLKGNTSFEFIKTNYKHILSLLQGNNPNEEEEEQIQEDEQFAYELKMLIDYAITEDFEIIDNFLSGELVKGIFGLDQEDIKPKEEELDLKFLDEI